MIDSTHSFAEQIKSVADLLHEPSGDRSAIVLVEGGTWQKRWEVAEHVKAVAIEAHFPVIEINFSDISHVPKLGPDYAAFDTVTKFIRNSMLRQHEQQRPVVLIYNYERAYKLDGRLRHFFSELREVAAWVLSTSRLLSTSRDTPGAGYFLGYSTDDQLGQVIVMNMVKPKEAREQPVHSARSIVTPAPMESQSLHGLQSPPTYEQIEAALRAREGQTRFRADLLQIFEGRCIVTGCVVDALLEAAHIEPYSEAQNHRLSNGLILRTDIHTLFDKGLLGIRSTGPQRGQVFCSSVLQKDSMYLPLHMKSIALPVEDAETRGKELKSHFLNFAVNGGLN